jgi:hypothetical protein
MRQDQIDRLQDLAEQIGDVFMEEADPANWNGAGVPLASLDKDARGGRYWDKKNAIQTGTLLARVLDLRDRDKGQVGPGVTTPAEDAEKEIKRFEKQAKDMVNAVLARATSKG